MIRGDDHIVKAQLLQLANTGKNVFKRTRHQLPRLGRVHFAHFINVLADVFHILVQFINVLLNFADIFLNFINVFRNFFQLLSVFVNSHLNKN